MTTTAEAFQSELNRLRTTLAPFDPETAEPRDHFQHAVLELIATTVHRILGDLDREEGVQDAPTAIPQDTPPEQGEAVLHFTIPGTIYHHSGGGQASTTNLVVRMSPDSPGLVILDLHTATSDGRHTALQLPLAAGVATELGHAITAGGAR